MSHRIQLEKSLPRALTRRFLWSLLLIVCMLQSGCLATEESVFTQADAEDIPGGAGIWERVNGQATGRFFARRVSTGSYLAGSSYLAGALTASDGQPKIPYLAIHLKDGFFILQLNDDEHNSQMLVLSQVTEHYLVLYTPDLETRKAAAARVHMPLNGKSKIGESGIPKGVSKAKVKEFFLALIDDPSKLRDSLIYKKIGGFKDADKDQYDILAANRAYDDNDYKKALPAYLYLADRGNADAQGRLALMYASSLFDSTKAIAAAKEAFANSRPEAAYLLAQLYAMGGGDGLVPNGVKKTPDYDQAVLWAAKSTMAGVRKQDSTESMTAWATRGCSLPELKQKHPDLKECVDAFTTWALTSAKQQKDQAVLGESIIESIISVGETDAALAKVRAAKEKEQQHLDSLHTREEVLREKERDLLNKIKQACAEYRPSDPRKSQPPCAADNK